MPITAKGVEMGEVKRQTHSARFRAKVGLKAMRGVKALNRIAQQHGVGPVQAGQRKKRLHDSRWLTFST